MSTHKHSAESDRLALTAEQLAAALQVSQRHVWAMHSAGRLPRPIRLGRAVRWPAAAIEGWLAAGCPSREDWERRSTEGGKP